MEQTFTGEHLLPGQIGQFLLVFSFIASLFSLFSYLQVAKFETTKPDLSLSWLKLSRLGFVLHAFAIIGIFVTLFYIIQSHLFEYHYAWKHSSTGLKAKYLLACFWEGSEGSFLLWTFWHAILGFFVIAKGRQWESRVMVVVLFVQAILCTLQLGIYFGDTKIGASAFTLLRNEMQGAPIFQQANYLEFIKDGSGLNPLLQNYWMVIHPPILFLGFALTLFPFAYAIAALWKGEYKTWVNPALRWTLATGAILGTGIMMGGAWAYESLTFGGYWAWDPVENASLVPWLIVISAIHTLIIYKSTGRSLKITLVFFILQYILIWYSTFLTRTGILGDTSVHAFTGEGASMKWHLLIAIILLLLWGIILLAKQWRKMPRIAGEEETSSREFWMLIGSIVLLISSMQIIFATSLPVWAPLYKSIFGSDVAPPTNREAYYNNIQVWFAIIVAMLTAATQYLKYKKSGNLKPFWKINSIILLASLALSVWIINWQKIAHLQYMVFLCVSLYALLANTFYLITAQKGNLKKAGGSITHIGFGMMLLGILFSAYKKEVISKDISGKVMNFGKETFEENAQESRNNVMIYRNTAVPMGEYMVRYLGDSTDNKNDPPITYFRLRFDKTDKKTGETIESFNLYPDAFINAKGQDGMSSNPDARHYWNKDIFVYITSAPNPKDKTDTSAYHPLEIKKGDSVFVSNGYFVFEGFNPTITNKNYKKEAGDVPVGVNLKGFDVNGSIGNIQPVFYIRGSQSGTVYDSLSALGTFIKVDKINPETETVTLGIKQRAQQDDYIVMKALVFPMIWLLWLGIIIMIVGFFVSLLARREKSK
ncbi:hypothetical protein DBR32_01265 [Taibaiella sp. KBW10]|uniref:cytochrome c biogenesis protein CcsA n=1 Tax=Taibaiella sp. KBW10 TaxID=2153357 RepID=UPI000F5969BB|nr:cytochrome c biogenesis protein CcsA [Taibaiella sp. KBW10]RQO32267.1 hypothetical protein DBR32_01265 [Taibaiella sp. KBW10]